MYIDKNKPLLSNLYNDDYLFRLYKYLQDNYPIYWSEYHNCWVVTDYSNIINGLKDYKQYTYKNTGSMVVRDLVTHVYEEDHLITQEEKDKFFDIEEPPEYLINRKTILDYYNFCLEQGLSENINNSIINLFNSIDSNKEIDFINYVTDKIPAITLCYMMGLDSSHVDNVLNIAKLFWESVSIKERIKRYKSAAKYIYTSQPDIFKMVGKNIDGSVMTTEMVMRICMGFLIGGANSMTGSLPGLLHHMNEHANEFNKVQNNNLLKNNFVQESLRHSFTMSHLVRTSTSDHYINDIKINKNDKVAFILSAGNFDKKVFGSNSYEFCIDRDYKKINLVFGHGTYRCIGQSIGMIQLEHFIDYLIINSNNIKISKTIYKDSRDFTGATYKNILGSIIG